MRAAGAVLALVMAGTVQADDPGDCGIKWWKRDIHTHSSAYYRGQVRDPEAVRTVYVEVWRRGRLIGESVGYTNPRGVFEAYVLTSDRSFSGSRVVFSCR